MAALRVGRARFGMCSSGWGDVFSFWANVISFRPDVFTFRPDVFTLARDVFSFRRYALVGGGARKEGKMLSFGKLRTGLRGRRDDEDVSTLSGRCVQFLARCVSFSAECVQFPCECVHFGEGCVSDEGERVGEGQREENHGDRRRDAAGGSPQLNVTHYPAVVPTVNLGAKCKHGRSEPVHGRQETTDHVYRDQARDAGPPDPRA